MYGETFCRRQTAPGKILFLNIKYYSHDYSKMRKYTHEVNLYSGGVLFFIPVWFCFWSIINILLEITFSCYYNMW